MTTDLDHGGRLPDAVSKVAPRVVTLMARAMSKDALGRLAEMLVEDPEQSSWEMKQLRALALTALEDDTRVHALRVMLNSRLKAAELVLRAAQLMEVIQQDRATKGRPGKVSVTIVEQGKGRGVRLEVQDGEDSQLDYKDETAEGESVGQRLGIAERIS